MKEQTGRGQVGSSKVQERKGTEYLESDRLKSKFEPQTNLARWP